jgi:hypothetical protein
MARTEVLERHVLVQQQREPEAERELPTVATAV